MLQLVHNQGSVETLKNTFIEFPATPYQTKKNDVSCFIKLKLKIACFPKVGKQNKYETMNYY